VHDTLDVLCRWGAGLPAGHLHVVTVPPPGAAPDLLWRRFASVLGLRPEGADLSAARPNTSLGQPEAEVLRRLNLALPPERIPDWFYSVHIKEQLAHEVLAARPVTLRPRLTPQQDEWARERAGQVVAGLQRSGYDVVGSLDDLVPAPADVAERRPGAVPKDQVLDAAVAALAAVLARDYDRAGAGVDATYRVKRAVRRFSARHPAVARLRVLASRVSGRIRARRR
jgi:hypothetical protein